MDARQGWLRAPTRYADWPRAAAATLLSLLVLAMAGGALLRPTGINAENGPVKIDRDGGTDRRLYERIVGEMRAGGGYYAVTAPALREGNYPLKPFVAFRLPTLATMLAVFPPFLSYGLMLALIVSVLVAWTVRLRPAFVRPTPVAIGALLLAGGVAVAAQPAMIVFHEIWAALLIALSLALRRDGRWWAAVAAGLAAVLIRETALPYLLAMAALALLFGFRREALAWIGAVAIFIMALGLHAAAVAAVTLPGDPTSPGWNALGGWRFFLSAMRLTTPLTLFPLWASALLIPLALLGWGAWKSVTALRVLAVLCGYATMLMIFGRPDNFYWGLMIAPLLLVGLVFAPAALRDLAAAASRPRLDTSPANGH